MKYYNWINEWFDNYVKPSAKSKTAACYKSLITNHIIPRLGEYETEDITPLVIQKNTSELLESGSVKKAAGLSPKTVNLIITIIQSSLHVAAEIGVMQVTSLGKVRRPKSKDKKVVCFSLAEQHKIEQAVLKSKKVQMIGIILCLYTGLRIGELLALEWSDVDLKKHELSVTKSCTDGVMKNGRYGRITDTPKTDTSVRIIPLPKQLIPIIKEVKKNNRSIYVVGNGDTVISVRAYQRSFESLQKRIGIAHRGFHALRHTFATRALERGMDVKTLAEILGHKNAAVTLNIYAHSFMEHKKQMINKLGALFEQSFNI